MLENSSSKGPMAEDLSVLRTTKQWRNDEGCWRWPVMRTYQGSQFGSSAPTNHPAGKERKISTPKSVTHEPSIKAYEGPGFLATFVKGSESSRIYRPNKIKSLALCKCCRSCCIIILNDQSTFKSPNWLVSILDLDAQSADHLVRKKHAWTSNHRHITYESLPCVWFFCTYCA